MAFCFTDSKLVGISTDKVSSDLYHVENLISNDAHHRSKGFMVEYYIRPPVSIILDFTSYNLDLMFLKLGLHLRQHKTNKVEVFVVNHDGRQKMETLIARKTTNDKCLVISNPFYRPHPSLPSIEHDCVDVYTIGARLTRSCVNISQIIVKIISTLNSTVPCLSSLEVYGKPHLSNPRDVDCFLNLFQTTATESKSECSNATLDLEHLAPAEFYDSITHELMDMPYRLPSGKNVDKTTLDRCLDNATGMPMDPFTRLPIASHSSRPIPNDRLKARIDAFRLTNGQSEIDSLNQFRHKLLQ